MDHTTRMNAFSIAEAKHNKMRLIVDFRSCRNSSAKNCTHTRNKSEMTTFQVHHWDDQNETDADVERMIDVDDDFVAQLDEHVQA